MLKNLSINPWFLSYGLVLGTSAALNTVFILYSVELFTHYTLSNVTSFWFYTGQTIYMLWNSFNDPIFGWFSDKQNIQRTQAIRYGGIVWGISFLLIWWPWGKLSFFSSSATSILSDTTLSSTSSLGSSPSTSSFTWYHILAGIHFTLTTCLYDSALTYVELNHSALLSEAIIEENIRAKANAYGAIFASIGTLTSFLAHSTWNSNNLFQYRIFIVILTVCSILAFHLAAKGLEQGFSAKIIPKDKHILQIEIVQEHKNTNNTITTPIEPNDNAYTKKEVILLNNDISTTQIESEGINLVHRRHNDDIENGTISDNNNLTIHHDSITNNTILASSTSSPSRYQSYWIFLSQIIQQRNVLIFMVIGALQSFDCRFEKSFFTPFMSILTHTIEDTNITTTLSSSSSSYFHNLQGLALSLSFVLPHIITISSTPYINYYGLATVIETIFFIRITIVILGMIIGHTYSSVFIIIFMLLNRVTSEAICRLSPLIGADIVDEDLYLQYQQDTTNNIESTNQSNEPSQSKTSAATLLGTLAFTSRVAQSLAPMLGYTFLPYKEHTSNTVTDTTTSPSSTNIHISVEEIPTLLNTITIDEQNIIWNLVIYVPLITVICQLILWRKYTLRNNYLKIIKSFITDLRGQNRE